MKKEFQDVNGNPSSTRKNQKISNYWILGIVSVMTIISAYNGSDIGTNLAMLLGGMFTAVNVSCEGKKACEFFSKKK